MIIYRWGYRNHHPLYPDQDFDAYNKWAERINDCTRHSFAPEEEISKCGCLKCGTPLTLLCLKLTHSYPYPSRPTPQTPQTPEDGDAWRLQFKCHKCQLIINVEIHGDSHWGAVLWHLTTIRVTDDPATRKATPGATLLPKG
jgi:hypothetical protein